MSRKSRWRFLCTEQLSQYHFGLRSDDGERRSYGRPKKSFPRETLTSGFCVVPQASHFPAGWSDSVPVTTAPHHLENRGHLTPGLWDLSTVGWAERLPGEDASREHDAGAWRKAGDFHGEARI